MSTKQAIGKYVSEYVKLREKIRLLEESFDEARNYLRKAAREHGGNIESAKWQVELNPRMRRSLDEKALRAKYGDKAINQFVIVDSIDVLTVIEK